MIIHPIYKGPYSNPKDVVYYIEGLPNLRTPGDFWFRPARIEEYLKYNSRQSLYWGLGPMYRHPNLPKGCWEDLWDISSYKQRDPFPEEIEFLEWLVKDTRDFGEPDENS